MQRPLLFVDIDGVLNPYGSEQCPEGYVEHNLFPGDDEPVRVCNEHSGWLRELSEVFDLIWGSSWTEEDRLALAGVLQLPTFKGAVGLPRGQFDARLKVPAVSAVAGDRALAWVDDLLTPEAYEWAGARAAPTLLVPVNPSTGLTRQAVDQLISWTRSRHEWCG